MSDLFQHFYYTRIPNFRFTRHFINTFSCIYLYTGGYTTRLSTAASVLYPLPLLMIFGYSSSQCFPKTLYNLPRQGTAVTQWLRCCATNRKVACSIPACVSGYFIDIKSFRSHYGPGVESASKRNEYQEYFVGGKGGRCVRLTTYHYPVPLSWNLGKLTTWKPLGHSGPVTGMLLLPRYSARSSSFFPLPLIFFLFKNIITNLFLSHFKDQLLQIDPPHQLSSATHK